MKLAKLLPLALLIPLASGTAEGWRLEKLAESGKLTDNGFYLHTAADLNGNRIKEIVIADFGEYGEVNMTTRPKWRQYNLFVVEWDPKSLKVERKFHKHWDLNIPSAKEASSYFTAWDATRMLAYPLGQGFFVETAPPYLGLEWKAGKYVLREQHRAVFDKATSWVFDFSQARCGLNMGPYPIECVLGIRDFFEDGKPRIVTLWKDVARPSSLAKGKLLVRVRRWEPGFPIEWEEESSRGISTRVDSFNWRTKDGLILADFGDEQPRIAYSLFAPVSEEEQQKQGVLKLTLSSFRGLISGGKEYHLRRIESDWKGPQTGGGNFHDALIRYTRDRRTWEIWGYGSVDAPDGLPNSFPRRVLLRPDLKGWERMDLRYATHENWLGTGHMTLADLDGNGLDEIAFVEETGERTHHGGEHPSTEYRNTKDYIHLLKWNGQDYVPMWVSPPYPRRGTKLLIEDVLGKGTKQLVVLNSTGAVEIWERK